MCSLCGLGEFICPICSGIWGGPEGRGAVLLVVHLLGGPSLGFSVGGAGAFLKTCEDGVWGHSGRMLVLAVWALVGGLLSFSCAGLSVKFMSSIRLSQTSNALTGSRSGGNPFALHCLVCLGDPGGA